MVDHAFAEGGGAGRVGLGGGNLRAVRGQEQDADDGGPHRDHVPAADPECQARAGPSFASPPTGSSSAPRRRRSTRAIVNGHSPRAAERRDNRVLVARDEGIGHPGDPEQGDHRHHAGPEDRAVSGMSPAPTLHNTTISAAAASMTIWMIGVTDSGSTPPSSAGPSAVGPRRSRRCDHKHRAEEDRDAALRVRLQHDVLGRRRRMHLAGLEPAPVLGVVVELLPCRPITSDISDDADDAGRDRDQQNVDEGVALDLHERQDRRHCGSDRARRDAQRGRDGRRGERTLGPDLVRVRNLVDHRDDRVEGVARPRQDCRAGRRRTARRC